MARTIYGDHEKFLNTYYRPYPGLYFSGDGAMRDEDGHYQITGRVDDVINVKGHRIGTAELESCMVSNLLTCKQFFFFFFVAVVDLYCIAGRFGREFIIGGLPFQLPN